MPPIPADREVRHQVDGHAGDDGQPRLRSVNPEHDLSTWDVWVGHSEAKHGASVRTLYESIGYAERHLRCDNLLGTTVVQINRDQVDLHVSHPAAARSMKRDVSGSVVQLTVIPATSACTTVPEPPATVQV